MSQLDPDPSPDQRFATDLEIADAVATPARSADSLVVHGMLSMIAPDEPARLEARIERAIAAVHADSALASPIASIGHAAAGLGASHAIRRQHASWRRRIALAGGGIGIAAVLGFAVLFTPSGQSQSGSQAYAALDSIRAATARTEDRTFRVRIEHTGPRDAGRPGMPTRDAMRDGARGRDGMRDGVREGELVLGSGGRYTLVWRGPGPDRAAARSVMISTGFDGTEYWAVLPDGTVHTSDHPAKLKLPPLFGTEPARQGDDDEQLTLDSMLARLERGYEITFADRAPTQGAGGTPLIEVTATRRAGAGRRDRDQRMPAPGAGLPRSRPGPSGERPGPGGERPGPPGPGPGPDRVRVLADASTFDVERLEARWAGGMGGARMMLIERLAEPDAPASRPDGWFTPAAHTRDR